MTEHRLSSQQDRWHYRIWGFVGPFVWISATHLSWRSEIHVRWFFFFFFYCLPFIIIFVNVRCTSSTYSCQRLFVVNFILSLHTWHSIPFYRFTSSTMMPTTWLAGSTRRTPICRLWASEPICLASCLTSPKTKTSNVNSLLPQSVSKQSGGNISRMKMQSNSICGALCYWHIVSS